MQYFSLLFFAYWNPNPCPQVSAAVALAWEKHPAYTNQQIIKLIMSRCPIIEEGDIYTKGQHILDLKEILKD